MASLTRNDVFRILTPLQREVEKCAKCKISLTRKQPVFGKGNPLADLVIFGEAPGQDDDMQGSPFMGRAGTILSRALEAIGRNEGNTYFLMALKCRPSEETGRSWTRNRPPTLEELKNCSGFLRRQLEALPNVRLILGLGGTAVSLLLSQDPGSVKVGSARQKFFNTLYDYCDVPEDRRRRVFGLATYSTGYVVREENAEYKAVMYQDFRLAADFLSGKLGEPNYEADGGPRLYDRREFIDQGSDGIRPWDRPLERSKELRDFVPPQVAGRLLPHQRDQYTSRIYLDDMLGRPVDVESFANTPTGAKLVFGMKPVVGAGGRKSAAPKVVPESAEEPPAFALQDLPGGRSSIFKPEDDDDVPF